MITLYKRGKFTTRFWQASIKETTVIIEHGIVDGKITTDKIECRSLYAATAEYDSRVAKKIAREGYTTKEQSSPPGLPMLLHNFRDHSDKMSRNVYFQPKLDGYRCIGSKHFMLTRKNELISSLPHLQQELKNLPEDVYLDGEIYQHDTSLQVLGSFIRSHTPQPGHEKLKYVVFDIQIPNIPYRERLKRLEQIFSTYKFQKIELLPSEKGLKTAADLYLDKYTKKGYEGVVIRSLENKYEKDTRSYSVQKYKPIFKQIFRVTHLKAAARGREQGLAIAVCRTDDGQTFSARIAADAYTRAKMYRERETYVNGLAIIEFSDWTDGRLPQHPRCVTLMRRMVDEKEKEV